MCVCIYNDKVIIVSSYRVLAKLKCQGALPCGCGSPCCFSPPVCVLEEERTF